MTGSPGQRFPEIDAEVWKFKARVLNGQTFIPKAHRVACAGKICVPDWPAADGGRFDRNDPGTGGRGHCLLTRRAQYALFAGSMEDLYLAWPGCLGRIRVSWIRALAALETAPGD